MSDSNRIFHISVKDDDAREGYWMKCSILIFVFSLLFLARERICHIKKSNSEIIKQFCVLAFLFL